MKNLNMKAVTLGFFAGLIVEIISRLLLGPGAVTIGGSLLAASMVASETKK